MDNSGSRPAVSGEGEAAARLLNTAQVVVGCPDWCSWAVTQPYHLHCVSEGAEIVTGWARSLDDGLEVEVVLEVRHAAAPFWSLAHL